MKKPLFPTSEEIQSAINLLEGQRARKDNPISEEGTKYCLKLLNDRLKDPENPYFIAQSMEEWSEVNEIFKSQIKGVEKLEGDKNRTKAVLCVDWLNGNTASINFLKQE